MWLFVLEIRYSVFTEVVNSQNLQSKDRGKTKTIAKSKTGKVLGIQFGSMSMRYQEHLLPFLCL